MAALMILIAVVATYVLQRTVGQDAHLVHAQNAAPLASEGCCRALSGCRRRLLLPVGEGEAVFSQSFLFLLFFLALGLEVHHDAVAGYEVFVRAQLHDDAAALGPFRSVGGARVPRQREVVSAGEHRRSVVDDALFVMPVEEQAPGVLRSRHSAQSQIRLQLAQQVVGFGHVFGLRGRSLIDGEGAESERAVLTEGIECAHAAVDAASAFGDEERVAGHGVLRCPRLEACVVDVGSQQVDARRTAFPYLGEVSQRSGRRIFARTTPARVHGGVDEERTVADAARHLCQPLHVAGVVPGHELLVGVVVGAEDLLPRAPFLQLQRLQQRVGHGLAIGFLGQRRVVAGIFEHADFVLYLYHRHRSEAFVLLCQVLHQLREHAAVGLENFLREGTRYLERLPRPRHGAREAFRVLLEPCRGVAAHGVLPRTEPQQHHLQTAVAGAVDDAVNEREVVAALLRFGQIPAHRHQHGVQSERLHARHHLVDVADARGGRVRQLAAEDEQVAQPVGCRLCRRCRQRQEQAGQQAQ